jgi:hypothetical protein
MSSYAARQCHYDSVAQYCARWLRQHRFGSCRHYRLNRKRAGTSPSVVVDGIEIVQSIRDINNSVTLIAGKRTLVRVYVRGGPTQLASGILAAEKDGAEVENVTSEVGYLSVDTSSPLRPRREDLKRSLNFILPKDFDAQGRWMFWLRSVKDTANRDASCGNCPITVKNVTMPEKAECIDHCSVSCDARLPFTRTPRRGADRSPKSWSAARPDSSAYTDSHGPPSNPCNACGAQADGSASS